MTAGVSAAADRRAFVGQLATGLAALGVAGAVPSAAGAMALPPAAMPPGAGVPQGAWDFSWLERLTAPYRAVFDSALISNGTMFFNANSYMDGLHAGFGVADADINVVIVIRHTAVPLLFGHTSWERFPVGEVAKVNDPVTNQPARRNPHLSVVPGNGESAYTLQGLQARGAIILGCNHAFEQYTSQLATRSGKSVDDVRSELLADLPRGVTLMPNGVFAVLVAQERGCRYFKST